MAKLHFETEIRGSAEAIFSTIADLTGYHRWLGGSDSFESITEISALPVGVGTTYTDAGPAGTRYGTITEFDPPATIVFHQPMQVTGPIRGTIDIHVRCTLVQGDGVTHVARDLTIRPHGLLLLAQPIMIAAFRRENERLLSALKRHIEGDGHAASTRNAAG
jgi:uncharacterized protein YndB with AHSA1/START domain